MVGWCERPDRKDAKKGSLNTFTVARNICRVYLEGMDTSGYSSRIVCRGYITFEYLDLPSDTSVVAWLHSF